MSNELLITGFMVACACGLFGVLVVLRRLALVSDALSHVALPGLALAMMLGLPPFLGAFLLLFLSVIFIHIVQKKFELGTETLVGVLFTTALAVGILITSQESVLDALFGDISKLTTLDVVAAFVGSLFVCFFTLIFWKHFLKAIISPELALGEQLDIKKVDFIFLILLTLTVAIGIKTIGTLLMGALIILPASIAKNVTHTVRSMAFVSVAIALLTVFGGLYVSSLLGWLPGPTVVLFNSILFALSLFIF